MASQFKIPKKKHQSESDSAHLHLQSPLSRLQCPAPNFKGYGNQPDKMHAGNTLGLSLNRHRKSLQPPFRDKVKTLLGLNRLGRGGASAANHRAAGSSGQRAEASYSLSHTNDRWRPKRASDRLLQPEASSEWTASPPQKKKSESSALSISVVAVDSLAALRGQEHAGSQRGDQSNTPTCPEKPASSSQSSSDPVSEDHFVLRPSSSSAEKTAKVALDRRRSLNRTAWKSSDLEDARERERRRWREFKARKDVGHLRPRRPKHRPLEPIVLSSEEEEEKGGAMSSKPTKDSGLDQFSTEERGHTEELLTTPSFLQLEFSSLHIGLTHANANGHTTVTGNGVTVPLRVSGGEDGEVTVVASEVRGYGVWDGGVARDGALLDGWEGPAPSLLFLWVSDAQANLLQRELSAVSASTSPSAAPPCCCLLLVLKEQLQELHSALLASILDMEEYQRGRSSSSPSSPLDWTDGLMLLHSCPPPVDQHLLRLLGHSADSDPDPDPDPGPGPVRRALRNKISSLNSCGLQQLPNRLIQYPPPPSKGSICVTKEDLVCLDAGEFLNDVIIDFYLKFLLLEGVGGAVAERSHVFSSFFYKQLSRRRAAGEDDAPSVPDRHMRHQRVKTWTRHVDIFTKDFLFVPVNQEAHWFLVVVCFPGLEDVQYEEFHRSTGSVRVAGKHSLRPHPPPDCTQQGRLRDTVLKKPCILVMDSLKLSYHENICTLLRDYLQVEWTVRRGTSRVFTSEKMRSCSCRVPQQDNSSDCGLYLLQYTESFLQNPVVHFEFPLRLEHWFPRQQVRQKREEIRRLIVTMHQSQK
ncbi:sentrin-specific protease 7b isoform X1 [Solea solea]|uniref:sentrin-specific protease 7b isoform X1 n=1 Tax=Solea solea TaxID=90069 RepID=UPI00272BA5FC|nr:sentrin-specific protease 7b isoform X1 [Solea solea]XP_058478516.1 sentrin-specific protease 7b isoform X1 [Solea solea]XP_058478517.1 sentrin-specific protease 7b isoform X1 [Solea solea]XP_058478519.1 sentrin-specific protease 7b isoform X1 [Solea solea]